MIAYGNARDLVLGLEVVLADGRILSDLSKLKKNNTGYDLKNLFIGSEGTLGIITAAVLKLYPRPRAVETAFIGLASPRAALALLDLARDIAGGEITSFELIPRIGLDFVLAHFSGAREVLSGKHAWYVLLELSSQNPEGLAGRSARARSKRQSKNTSSRMRRSPPRSTSAKISGSCANSCRTPSAMKAARSSMTSVFPSRISRLFSTKFARAVQDRAMPGARLVPSGTSAMAIFIAMSRSPSVRTSKRFWPAGMRSTLSFMDRDRPQRFDFGRAWDRPIETRSVAESER